MKNRKAAVIILIILIVVCALVATVLLLLQTINPQTTTQPPVSAPVSAPDTSNVVKPGETPAANYVYALINNSDNIKIKTALGEELLISIDTKHWKNIQWSVNGSYVSALGETADGVFNLFIYNLSAKTWIQATLFDSDGVTSYRWVDNDTVLFTQGGWLHRYKYSSLNEIVKIYQIDATIVDISPIRTTVLLKTTDGKFQIVDLNGKVLFTLDKITITGSSDVLIINQVFYNLDSQSLFFVTDGNKFYDWNIGDPNTTEVKIMNDDGLDPSKVTLLCSQAVGIFRSYTILGNAVNFFDLDIVNNTITSITNKGIPAGATASEFECTNGSKVDFRMGTATQSSWYQLSSGKIQILVPLDEATEVAFKN